MMGKSERWQRFFSVTQLVLGLLLWIGLYFSGPAGTFSISSNAKFVFVDIGFIGPWVLLLCVFIASILANFYKFSFGSGDYFISFDIVFCVAAFFLVSPFAAVVIAVLSSSVDSVHRMVGRDERSKAELATRLVSTSGNRLLRFGLAWIAFVGSGGALRSLGSRTMALPLLIAFIVYFLSNSLFFLPEDLAGHGSARIFWKESCTIDVTYTFVLLTLGYLLAVVANSSGIVTFLMLGAFILTASFVFSKWSKTRLELESKVEDLIITTKATTAAASNLDVMPMVEGFARSLSDSLPTDGIGVVFYQRYSATIYVVEVEGEKSRSTYLSEERQSSYYELPLSEPSSRLGARLFEYLQPLETAPFTIPDSVFGLPLLHGGEPFGGIVLYAYKKGIRFEKHQDLLELCANSLVVGLENCFLHLQAIQDPLTGLYNRSYIFYRLEEELSFAARHRAPFGLLMIDLDEFKAVNDHLGHEFGDSVLRRIGDLLRQETRREDVPARYGGDEFIILLLGCPYDSALEKAEKIRRRITSRALPKEEAKGLSIGCSIGVLHSDSLRGERDIPTILRRLDGALYNAKQSGKNKVVSAK